MQSMKSSMAARKVGGVRRTTRVQKQAPVAASAEEAVTRRAALGLAAALPAALVAKPSLAAYGDAKKEFAGTVNTSGFIPYAGEGFAVLLPAKYNPASYNSEFPGIALAYEDNFDAVNKLSVIVTPTNKSKIEDYGSPTDYLKEVAYLLGQQTWQGDSLSEGGFKRGKTSVANVLDAGKDSRNGKTYYTFEILTRTADGNEGGRHHLLTSTVSGGKVYTLRQQVGDKRWFKGLERENREIASAFKVA